MSRPALEPLAALRAIAIEGILDDRHGGGGGLELVDFHRLAFQCFVVLEETAQHGQAMARQLLRLPKTIVLRIIDGNSQDFVVLLAAVDHRHQTDGAASDQSERRHGLLTQHQDVEWVVVFGQGLRNEALVSRIVDSRIQNAIQPQKARFLVQFVLDA